MALSLRFEPAPVDLPDAAEAATWGALWMSADDVCLTEVRDLSTQDVRPVVYGTVLPLAEWLAENWTALVGVTWPPPDAPDRARYEWRRSHCVRACGQGAALPNLRLWRVSRHSLQLQAVADSRADHVGERVEFLRAFDGQVSLDAARDALAGFVRGVVERCEKRAAAHPRTRALAANWASASGPHSAERAERFVAARLGLAWPHLEPTHRALVERISSAADLSRTGALTAVAPWNSGDVEAALEHVERLLARDGAASTALVSLKRLLRGSQVAESWRRGWADAAELRDALRVSSDRPLTHDEVTEGWDVQVERPVFALERHASIVGWRAGGRPFRLTDRGNTFRDTRDLWALCFGATHDKPSVVAIGPRGHERSVANAFAAELLAPVEAIRRAIGAAPVVSNDEIEEIADAVKAPPLCVLRQIQNHQLAAVD